MLTLLFRLSVNQRMFAQMEYALGVTGQASQLLMQIIPFLYMVHDVNKGYKKEK